MRKRNPPIPVKPLSEDHHHGISIEKLSVGGYRALEEADHSHRHDHHLFLFQERGQAIVEVDFEEFHTEKNSVIYVHPNQVHRLMKVDDAEFFLIAIKSEYLNSEYQAWLEEIVPTKPLLIGVENAPLIAEALSLCLTIFQKKTDKLYQSLLRDSCNTLVALTISLYLELSKPAEKQSRYFEINKAFMQTLEQNFLSLKRPSEYASLLNISTTYLNECVKAVTGFSVSHQIQQRIILEAKRLLYYSQKSVKEIAFELGYEDHAYFSRLFSKMTGMSPLGFKNKTSR